jgi:hypothetical protein
MFQGRPELLVVIYGTLGQGGSRVVGIFISPLFHFGRVPHGRQSHGAALGVHGGRGRFGRIFVEERREVRSQQIIRQSSFSGSNPSVSS